MSSFAWASQARPDAPVAVLLPGSGYPVQGPLLHRCAEILAAQGWHVEAVVWTVDEAAQADPYSFVNAAVEAAFDSAPPSRQRLVVAKSFGTFALPWAIENDVSGVWLTPVLTAGAVRGALERASERHLAVGGTGDALWRVEGLTPAGADVMTIAGANHSLEIADDWKESLAAQARVFDAVARHVESLSPPHRAS
jgi:hypothetical protein